MPPKSDLELYSVLGLKPDASSDAIKAQYRKMARQFHPDRNDGDEWCAEQLRKVIEAYEVLGDPARKADYDRRHAAPPPKQPDPPKPPPTQDYPRPKPDEDVWDYVVRPLGPRKHSTATILLSAILILVILAFALESVREYYDETRAPMHVAIFGDGDAPVGRSHSAPASSVSVRPVAVTPPAAPVAADPLTADPLAADPLTADPLTARPVATQRTPAPPPQAFVMKTKAGGGAPPNLEPFRPR